MTLPFLSEVQMYRDVCLCSLLFVERKWENENCYLENNIAMIK